MFSGKTSELLKRTANHEARDVVAFKHTIDTRYGKNEIVSHGGKACSARAVTSAAEILAHLPKSAKLIAIDEAHFFDSDLVDVTKILAKRGLSIVLTSLDPNSWGNPFDVVERLKSIVDETVPLQAICARCGLTADRTQRLTPIVNGNMVDGPENYEPRCRACWSPPPESSPIR